MKAALVLCCLALFVALYAAEYVCDNDSNNMPDCTNATNQRLKFRNFFDPTRYWMCNSTVAVAVPCKEGGFLVSANDCVAWSDWKWTPNCP